MRPTDQDTRRSGLIARLRHRQLELALKGAVRESARFADRARRVGRMAESPYGPDSNVPMFEANTFAVLAE